MSAQHEAQHLLEAKRRAKKGHFFSTHSVDAPGAKIAPWLPTGEFNG